MRASAAVLLIAAAAAGVSAHELPPPPDERHIRYSAEHFEHEQSTGPEGEASSTLLLRGDVVVEESTWTIRAGELKVDLERRTGEASGGLRMEDGLTTLEGERGEFDFEEHDGKVWPVRAEYPPWRIWGRSGAVDSKRKATFRLARFTSCGENPPHYHFRAGAVRVKPKKWLYATNALLYLGPVPVFYTPILWKPLNPRPLLRTRFSPGYDKRNGISLRTSTLVSISEAVYGKLFLDYYGAQGPGYGSELHFRASEEARGAVFGYRVKENSGRERWGVFGDHYQTINSSWAVQGRLQAQSDAEFNNHYARSNAFRLASEVVNNAAIVHRTALATTRLSYSRLDQSDPRLDRTDPARDRYRKQSESYPRLDFQTAPLSWKRSPLIHTLTAFADNRYTRGTGFIQRSAGATFDATRTVRLARGASLTPRAALSETYESRRDAATSYGSLETLRDTFTTRYELGGNLRANTPLGGFDVAHSFVRRMKPDTLRVDAQAPDLGIESNLLSVQDTIRPARSLLARLNTGYDFRTLRNAPLGFRQRVQPFTADLVWFPRHDVQVSLRDQYHLQDKNRAFLLQADWGDREKDFFGAGVTNTKERTNEYLLSQEFGWAPGWGGLKLAGALRWSATSLGGPDFTRIWLFEKELTINKDFHDFHTRLLLRSRPGGVKEVLFRIDLRMDRKNDEKVVNKKSEEEWFPWRKGKDSPDDRE